MSAYYNEIDKYAAQWLRNLIAAGLIAPGDVDERSIKDVKPDDLTGYTQCHFFAGIGGWSLAARLAGWPDDRPIWTGSCPCQPFSVAGRGKGIADERHLWPDFYRLIRGSRPAVVMGEQVAGSAGYGWFDGVQTDLEAEDYAARAVDIPACSVNAPQIRSRLYWLARTDRTGLEGRQSERGDARAEYAPTERNRSTGGRLDSAASPRHGQAGREALAAVRDGARWSESKRRGGDGGSCGMGGAAERKWRRSNNQQPYSDESKPVGRPSGVRHWEELGFWDDWQLIGPDPEGKYRRIKSATSSVDSGVPRGMGRSGTEELTGWAAPRAVDRSKGSRSYEGCLKEIERKGQLDDLPSQAMFMRDAGISTDAAFTPLVKRSPGDVGQIRGYGNAICPELAAEVIRAYMEATA